jgi:flagellar motor switch protein FliN/FliY
MADETPENTAAEPSPVAEAATDAASAPSASPASAAVTESVPANTDLAQTLDAGDEQADAAAGIDLSHLPDHTRSLLKIQVAVTVTLANQRRPIHEITELGPGTLVKFEKTFDEPLELSVGDLPIARGEVVKVGDKFGLRIGKLIRPHERFASVG